MKVAKKLLFLFFSIFLIYQSYELMKILLSDVPRNYSIVAAVVNSFLINLYITGVFAFPGFVFPTNRLLSSNYYKLKKPERLVKIYELLKVDIFKKALLIFFWGKKKNRIKYFNGTRGGLANLIYQSKQSEFGHLGAFVLLLFASISLLFRGYFLLAISTMLINFIGNFYPIILQRHHRMRIEKLTKK